MPYFIKLIITLYFKEPIQKGSGRDRDINGDFRCFTNN